MPDPQCDRFDPDAVPRIHWSCMTEDAAPGVSVGCELHCRVCRADETVPGEQGTSIYGRRWLRPHIERESRDAHGVHHFPRSGDPRLLSVSFWGQTEAHYELADVWQQIGWALNDPTDVESHEYFEHEDGSPWTICDGGAGANSCPVPSPLRMFYGELLVTCWTFRGWDWPPRWMECTGETSDNGPRQVVLGDTGLHNTAFFGLGAFEHRGETNACTPNAVVPCYGHREAGSSVCRPSPFNADDYYNSDEQWKAFDFMYVQGFDARFAGGSIEAQLKNEVMAFIESDRVMGQLGALHFDQIDSERRGQTAFANVNDSMGWWGRAFNMEGHGGEPVPWNDLPVVTALTGHLKRSGHAVTGELVIVAAHLRMHMVLHRIRTANPVSGGVHDDEELYAVYPHIRMECIVHLGIRTVLEDFGVNGVAQIVQTWRPPEERDPDVDVTLGYRSDANDSAKENFPVVLDVATEKEIDRIVWRLADRPVRVPSQFVWRGHMGHLSSKVQPDSGEIEFGGPSRDVVAHTLQTGNTSPCCKLARGFNGGQHGGLAVWGLASHADAPQYERHQIYEGKVVVQFASEFEC